MKLGRNFGFEEVNATAAETIARISAEMGVEKLIHVSAMNASEPQYTAFGKTSRYLEAKVTLSIA